MGRLPRPTTTLKFNKTPTWQTELRRIRRRVARGGKVTLYRARAVRGPARAGMRRTLRVRKGQSWASSPRMALQFALRGPADVGPGAAGLLFSITVPASEMRGIEAVQTRALERMEAIGLKPPRDHLPSSADYEWLGIRSTGDRGEWTAMRDQGDIQAFYEPESLELRPNRDRPDLKPKIVGTAVRQPDGKIRYGLARRLNRQRGTAARGGGA